MIYFIASLGVLYIFFGYTSILRFPAYLIFRRDFRQQFLHLIRIKSSYSNSSGVASVVTQSRVIQVKVSDMLKR